MWRQFNEDNSLQTLAKNKFDFGASQIIESRK
jgi:hypothetical protein